jgi:hypothetical protein
MKWNGTLLCADTAMHKKVKAVKFMAVYRQKCNVGLRSGECFEDYHSKINYYGWFCGVKFIIQL